MPDDVGQRLLHDPVGGHLDRGRQRRQLAGHVDVDPQAAVGAAALGQPLQRADQAQLVERRRAQAVHQPADVGDRRPQLAAQLARQRLGGGRVLRDERAQDPGLHGQPGQLGAEAVVQVAAQPTALLLAGGDQPLAGALQVGGQPHGRDGDAGLPGEVGEQPPVGGGEPGLARPHARAPASPRASPWCSSGSVSVAGDRLPGRPPAARRPPSAIAAYGQPQRLPDGRHDRRQHGVRRRACPPAARRAGRARRTARPRRP